jgi:hypothetical protein
MGKSGLEVSEVFPKLGEVIDDIAVIRSLWTDIPAHEVAQRFMNTGSLQLPKPSVGSWVVYGLGTDNQNMPGFITIGGRPSGASLVPARHVSGRERELFARDESRRRHPQHPQSIQPDGASAPSARPREELNEMHAKALQKDAQLEARIEAFEMAFKMQTEATEAFDIARNPSHPDDVRQVRHGLQAPRRPPPRGARRPLRPGGTRRLGSP